MGARWKAAAAPSMRATRTRCMFVGEVIDEIKSDYVSPGATSAVEPGPSVPHFSGLQRYSTRRNPVGEVRSAGLVFTAR